MQTIESSQELRQFPKKRKREESLNNYRKKFEEQYVALTIGPL